MAVQKYIHLQIPNVFRQKTQARQTFTATYITCIHVHIPACLLRPYGMAISTQQPVMRKLASEFRTATQTNSNSKK